MYRNRVMNYRNCPIGKKVDHIILVISRDIDYWFTEVHRYINVYVSLNSADSDSVEKLIESLRN